LLNKSFDKRGKQLIYLLDENNVDFISGIEAETIDGYRDNIHLNEKGQRLLAQALLNPLRKHIAAARNNN
jgi:lysophospholipase L1-like esterase